MSDINKLYINMMKRKLVILIFLTLGTLLALLLSYYGWEDVYIRLQHHEKISMYEPLLLVSYADFTLLSILGCISILSVLRKGKLWIPVIKCIIVNVVLWMILTLVISIKILVWDQLIGIILITIFSLIVWGLFKIWIVTNALTLEYEAQVNTLQKGLNRVIDAQEDNQNVALEEIFGELDAMKVRSSMTLFDQVSPNDIFAETLDKYFEGKRCELTLKLIAENEMLNKREAFN